MLFGRFLIVEGGMVTLFLNIMLNCCLVSNMVYRWLFTDPILCLGSLQLFFIRFNSDLKSVVFEDFAHFFFIAATCLGVFMQVASPLSLYNPTLTSRWVSWNNRKIPNSSQVSAPSKLPIVMSKSDLIFGSWHVIAIEGGLLCVPAIHPFTVVISM